MIWTELAEKASWDLANRGLKLGLVWKIKGKSAATIIFDRLSLLFTFLFILWR
jgi:hypothetical protein